MAGTFQKAFAAVLMCGAAGLSGAALAQTAGTNTAPGASTASADVATGTGQGAPFLASVQSKSTPAKGLNRAAMARVDRNERQITVALNRASAASTGNANASAQASINGSSGTVTQ